MHGRCLAAYLISADVELLPAGAIPAHEFLQGLDAFRYRTCPDFVERRGRLVTEAMAWVLSVVCHRAGGYREYLEHGTDGIHFDSDDKAIAILETLRAEAAPRIRVSQCARLKAEKLFSDEARKVRAAWYIGTTPPVLYAP